MKVVATINLPGLSAGMTADTDPTVPYVARCLRAGFLLPLEPYDPDILPSEDDDGTAFDEGAEAEGSADGGEGRGGGTPGVDSLPG